MSQVSRAYRPLSSRMRLKWSLVMNVCTLHTNIYKCDNPLDLVDGCSIVDECMQICTMQVVV